MIENRRMDLRRLTEGQSNIRMRIEQEYSDIVLEAT
jgi:hypothetical protein